MNPGVTVTPVGILALGSHVVGLIVFAIVVAWLLASGRWAGLSREDLDDEPDVSGWGTGQCVVTGGLD
jgi:hypothetical protein